MKKKSLKDNKNDIWKCFLGLESKFLMILFHSKILFVQNLKSANVNIKSFSFCDICVFPSDQLGAQRSAVQKWRSHSITITRDGLVLEFNATLQFKFSMLYRLYEHLNESWTDYRTEIRLKYTFLYQKCNSQCFLTYSMLHRTKSV